MSFNINDNASQIPDSSVVFRKFKQTQPKDSGSLPIPAVPNIKTIVLDWIKFAFSRFNIKYQITITGDYPSQLMLGQIITEEGKTSYNNLAGISVVALNKNVVTKAIGQIAQTQTDLLQPADTTTYGWLETVELEITYWSVDSVDRDYGADLVTSVMQEAQANHHFLKNGIFIFEPKGGYDTASDKIISNNYIFMHVMRFDLTRLFFGEGTLDRQLTIINQINMNLTGLPIDSTPIPPTIPEDRYKSPFYTYTDRILDTSAVPSTPLVLSEMPRDLCF